MRLVDGLQSAIMYRTGKPLHGRANVFVLHPLIIIYVVSASLLLATEGAQASPSKSDIEEAEKIVGQFLHNETGSKWLASLAAGRSAPLTTQDLMKEIRKATRPNGRVWLASKILSDSIDEQARKGNNTVPIFGQTENWKDILEHIEEQDDIICLYRKSTEETSKKADDWKKFLRSVTPGYVVHLAIDTGSKYVICLKKIEIPETTPAEISSTQETPSTVANSEVSSAVTSAIPSSTTSEKLETTTTSGILKNRKNLPSVKLDFQDENCHDKSVDGSEGCRDENSDSREDIADEVFKEESTKLPKRRMENDVTAGYEKYPANFTHERRSMSHQPAKQRQWYLGNDGSPSIDSPPKTPSRVSYESSHDAECMRPIILVMQNGDAPLGYLREGQSEFPTKRYFGAPKFPWFPPFPWPHFTLLYPQLPKLPTSTNQVTGMPQYTSYSFNIPIGPYHYFGSLNESPQLPWGNNLHRPIVLSHNSQVFYQPPRETMHRPVMNLNSQAGEQIARQPVRTVARPAVRRVQNPLVRQPPRIKPHASQSYRDDPSFENSMRDPFGSHSPRRVYGLARNTQWTPRNIALPQRRIPVSQSYRDDPSFENSMRDPFGSYSPRRLHGSVRNTQWNLTPRNIALPQRRIPSEAYTGQNIRQFLQKYRAPIYGHAKQDFVQKPAPPLARIPAPTFHNTGEPRDPSRSSLQGIPRHSLLIDKLKRQNPVVISGVYQRPNFILNPNYSTLKRLVQPIRPVPIPWNPRCPLTGYPLRGNSVPCQSPCDKPVKLQIVINGKVQEPLKVAVINEPGQRVEIVGSGKPIMPYGSRAMRGKTPLDSGSGGLKKIDQEVSEVNQRIFKSESDTKKYVDDEKEENQKKSKEKKNEVDEKVSSVGSTTITNGILDDKSNSTTELKAEVTTESIKGLEITQRFLHEGTTESTSTISAAPTVANTTLSATTNSTIAE